METKVDILMKLEVIDITGEIWDFGINISELGCNDMAKLKEVVNTKNYGLGVLPLAEVDEGKRVYVNCYNHATIIIAKRLATACIDDAEYRYTMLSRISEKAASLEEDVAEKIKNNINYIEEYLKLENLDKNIVHTNMTTLFLLYIPFEIKMID